MPRAAKPAVAEGGATPGLDRALRRVLTPLVRLLLARGVRYPALAAALKDIYFEAALEALDASREPTTSQISLSTGLHRKDVRRMREGEAFAAITPHTTAASEVFTRWISERRYLDAARRPRRLPRLASVGGERSFEALATGVSRDVRPRALLDELLRLGVVRVDQDDHVVLDGQAFVPKRGSDEMHYYFGENVHDHLAAAVHNLLGREPMMLEQAIFGDDLSEASVAEIAERVREGWRGMVRDIVPRASELDQRDARAGNTGHRMRFGIYFYSESKAKTAAAQASPAGPPGREEKQRAHTRTPRSGRRKRSS